MTSSVATTVYVALRADGLRKLGSTRSLKSRLATLPRDGGCPITLERAWECTDARTIERVCHILLQPYRAFPELRCLSEIYKVEFTDVEAAVLEATSRVAAGDLPDFGPLFFRKGEAAKILDDDMIKATLARHHAGERVSSLAQELRVSVQTLYQRFSEKDGPDPLQRKTVSLPASVWREIERYRAAERIPVEAEAVRRLILDGLRAVSKKAGK